MHQVDALLLHRETQEVSTQLLHVNVGCFFLILSRLLFAADVNFNEGLKKKSMEAFMYCKLKWCFSLTTRGRCLVDQFHHVLPAAALNNEGIQDTLY